MPILRIAHDDRRTRECPHTSRCEDAVGGSHIVPVVKIDYSAISLKPAKNPKLVNKIAGEGADQ